MPITSRVKIKRKGLYDLRRAPGVTKRLLLIADTVAGRANQRAGLAPLGPDRGYRVSSQQGAKRPQGRWRTTVITATNEARVDNAKNNTLIRELT